jgi:recombination protein RecA
MSKNDLKASLDSVAKLLGGKDHCHINIFSKIKEEVFEVIPFGIPALDEASSVGGIKRGGVVELYGVESSGKSWLTLKLIASAQKLGLRAGLLDVEHAFMPEWAARQGVDLDRLLYGSDFEHGEDCLNHAKAMAQSGEVDLQVIDSTAALVPKEVLEANIEDKGMAQLARMMSTAVSQIQDAGAKNKCTTVFVNQLRNKVGVVFGNPEDTPGGRALKFYASQRISVKRVGVIRDKGTKEEKGPVMGIRSHIKFEKNRVGKPFGEAEFEIYFDPTTNGPLIQLLDMAYRKPLQLIKRKKVESEMHYLWGLAGESEDTGCTSLASLADWLMMQGYVVNLLDRVEEESAKNKLVVPEEVLQLRNAEVKPATETEPETKE